MICKKIYKFFFFSSESKHGEWKCHVSEKSVPFIVKVDGPESAAKDVYDKVVQDISSI